jgi:hypothetical protein
VYTTAMSQTADMMRTELNALRSKMHAAMDATGHVPGKGTEARESGDVDIEKIKTEIARLKASVVELDKQLAEVCTAVDCWHDLGVLPAAFSECLDVQVCPCLGLAWACMNNAASMAPCHSIGQDPHKWLGSRSRPAVAQLPS